MDLVLKNVGVIREAEIKLDGLTVITGMNGTGKSTIGKAAYSLVSAVADLQEVSLKDKIFNTQNAFMRILSNLMGSLSVKDFTSALNRFQMGEILRAKSNFSSLEELVLYVKECRLELEKILESDLEDLLLNSSSLNSDKNFMDSKTKAVSDMDTLIVALESDPELKDYASRRVEKTLNKVYNYQIYPQKYSIRDEKSQIKLYDDETVYCDIQLNREGIIDASSKVMTSSLLNGSVLIDNPYQLDDFADYIDGSGKNRFLLHLRSEEYLKNINIMSPKEALILKLMDKTSSIFADMMLDAKANQILGLISQAFSQEIISSKDGYVVGSEKLNIKNLATGMKLFAIIKTLISKGHIQKDTLLVLDEPESHLHPDWQNLFAEIVVLLVKQVGVRVVLTTHSAHFMLAIECMMRKHHINEVSNFYLNKTGEDGYFASVSCVNDKIDEIYSEFVKPYTEMFELRKSLI